MSLTIKDIEQAIGALPKGRIMVAIHCHPSRIRWIQEQFAESTLPSRIGGSYAFPQNILQLEFSNWDVETIAIQQASPHQGREE